MRTLFFEFINEYKESVQDKHIKKNETLHELFVSAKATLLNSDNLPSLALHEFIKKLELRTNEPMKIAISGQFSSGKSTFLNALLAKNILPTGITPVTSKINYIKYGEKFSMKVSFHDGREAFYAIENISSFTDQRGEVEDIAYLTLYAPLELLKDIVFVDTPGLNSQTQSDTKTTHNALKEVDGIIWLTLIDNAGKSSEIEVLEEYLHAYQDKSLCVLNQKDKFSPDQIEQTINYIKSSLSKYFSEVIAISGKEALHARANESAVILENVLSISIGLLEKKIKKSGYIVKEELLKIHFDEFKKRRDEILSISGEQNSELLKKSNIEAVLNYIYKEIQPKVNSAKEFAIKKELGMLCKNLINQEDEIIAIFTNLETILNNFEISAQKNFKELKKNFTKSLNISFLKITEIIDKIAAEILLQVVHVKKIRYEKNKKSFLSKKKAFSAYNYVAPKINSDEVYKKLFYEENLIGKMFKQYLHELKTIQDGIDFENYSVYSKLESDVKRWQELNETVRKKQSVHSDIQFANVRKFAGKVYENILKPYNDEIFSNFTKMSSEFVRVGSIIEFNYQNATETVVSFLERKIDCSIKIYEGNPAQFRVYEPKLDEIKERLKSSFFLYELENKMQTKGSFISKNYDQLMTEFSKITKERVKLLNENKKECLKLKVKFENFFSTI